MSEFGLGMILASIMWFVIIICGYRAPITYDMINRAAQVCYINSNTKVITADSKVVNVECRNGAKFKLDRDTLKSEGGE